MCLVIDRNKHKELKCKIAKEDIPCYKFLILDEGNHKFITPFRYTEITFGEDSLVSNRFEEVPVVRQYMAIDPSNGRKIGLYEYEDIINHGIHAYTDLNTAIAESWKYDVWNYPVIIGDVVILLCYISKGTKYWIGQGNTICAEKLFFTSEDSCDSYEYRKCYIYHNISRHKYRETKVYYKNIK